MASLDRESVKSTLMSLLKELREDWEYPGELTEETGIFRDLGFESVDAIALSTAVEEQFGQTLPFTEFLTRARDQNIPDITIGYFLDFLMANLRGTNGKVSQ
jgi:acyl carrier protein